MARAAVYWGVLGSLALGAGFFALASVQAREQIPGAAETAPIPRPLAEDTPSANGDSSSSPGNAELLPPAGMGAAPPPMLSSCPSPGLYLQGPCLSEGQTPQLKTSPVQPGDQVMPLNLPTALQLANARPIVIAAAQASLQIAIARLRRVRVLWLPNFAIGATWYRHDGGGTANSGQEFILGRDQYFFGAGPILALPFADVFYLPRQARDQVAARRSDLQAAKNDALRNVAEAYFNVQQARGRMTGAQDVVDKARSLVRDIAALSKNFVSEIEIDRAKSVLAEFEQELLLRSQDWRIASADLTRELRLNPTTLIAPLEPPHLQVTLIAPKECVDELVPVGLVARPELAAQQALVKYALDRLRHEKMRPLLPTFIFGPNAVPAAPYVTTAIPYGSLMTGIFSSDRNGQPQPWVGRFDSMTMLVWELQNLGLGNSRLIKQRAVEQQRAVTELLRIQDRVAAEVTEAHARVQASAQRIIRTETQVKEARISYDGNLKAIGETYRFGDRQRLVNRPLEVVVALQQLARAYDEYYGSVSDYNKAQFELYWALGYPAHILECERNDGEILPVDTSRPPQMAPVNAPPPCAGCPR